MTAFWVGFWLVLVSSLVVYLCGRALRELNGGPVPSDDRWREFWRDDDRY